MFLEISQNSQENTCARFPFLIKLQALTYFNKKEILARASACNFIKSNLVTFTEEILNEKNHFCAVYVDMDIDIDFRLSN